MNVIFSLDYIFLRWREKSAELCIFPPQPPLYHGITVPLPPLYHGNPDGLTRSGLLCQGQEGEEIQENKSQEIDVYILADN